jgi:hypothetical protein
MPIGGGDGFDDSENLEMMQDFVRDQLVQLREEMKNQMATQIRES